MPTKSHWDVMIDAQVRWRPDFLYYFLRHAALKTAIAEGLKETTPEQIFYNAQAEVAEKIPPFLVALTWIFLGASTCHGELEPNSVYTDAWARITIDIVDMGLAA